MHGHLRSTCLLDSNSSNTQVDISVNSLRAKLLVESEKKLFQCYIIKTGNTCSIKFLCKWVTSQKKKRYLCKWFIYPKKKKKTRRFPVYKNHRYYLCSIFLVLYCLNSLTRGNFFSQSTSSVPCYFGSNLHLLSIAKWRECGK